MRSLLQRMLHGFGPGPENHIDLRAWRAATALRFVGVELRLSRGFAEVRLHHIDPDGALRDGSVHLVRTVPGSAFSPPLYLPDMGARLVPEVVEASADAEFELRVFTDDRPLLADPGPAYVLAAPNRAALQPTLDAFATVPGAGRLVLVLADDDGAADDPAISVLRAPVGQAWGAGLHALAYGAALHLEATHIALVEPGAQIPAATFERLRDLLRFARPDCHIGAVLHSPQGAVLAAGRRFDPTLPGVTAATEGPELAAGLIVLPRRSVYRLGLPWPGSPELAALEYPLRLNRGLGAPVVPGSLRVDLPALPATALETGDQTGALLLLLRERGAEAARDHLQQVARDLDGGTLPRAQRGLDALDALLADAPLPLLDTAPRPAQGALRLRWRLRGYERHLPATIDKAAHRARAHERDCTGISAWEAVLAGEPFVPGAGTRAHDAQIAALHARIFDQDVALRIALAAERRETEARLKAAGMADPARTRADLDRANILAVAALRQRHAGRRAVIIGNGPSLKLTDLDRLKGDITFASNKIFLAFDHTDWRPTYYSVEDHLVLENNRARIEQVSGTVKIFPSHMRDFDYHAPDTIFVPQIPPRSYADPLSDPDFPAFGTELTKGQGWGSTVVYGQIQLAAYMGCTEIVLIGIDHHYELPARKVGNTYVSEGERNHFHPEYRSVGEVWHQPNIEVLDVSYAKARTQCEARGIRIVNASRATRLEAFERADFDTLFPRSAS